MAPSDVDLLCAAQQAQSADDPARLEFSLRFDGYLRYLAARCCRLRGLHLSEVDDIVSASIVMVLYGENTARFNPLRGDNWQTYLHGIAKNAARDHQKGMQSGGVRHNWSNARVVSASAPTMFEDVVDAEDRIEDADSRDLVAAVIRVANEDERMLITRHFYRGETLEEIARSLGLNRTTVSRRLERFYLRVRAAFSASIASA